MSEIFNNNSYIHVNRLTIEQTCGIPVHLYTIYYKYGLDNNYRVSINPLVPSVLNIGR